MKTISSILQVIVAVSMLANVPAALAGDLTPQTYVAVDAEVRELTLSGMAERLALLSSGNSTPQQEAIIDADNRRAISQAYRDNGTTAAAHAAYGTQHADEIAAFLAAHPEWQAHFDVLADEMESLSSQLTTLVEGA